MQNSLLSALLTRRKVFVSYHHDNDQWHYDEFSRVFHDDYEAVHDNSLDRALDSDDPDYVMRRIRENFITGTSCTIVLCGSETQNRKYVDWEIKATLDKNHGLVGINLPSSTSNQSGVIVPDRFLDNYRSGYAVWVQWSGLTVSSLKVAIEDANSRSTTLIDNSRRMMQRNR